MTENTKAQKDLMVRNDFFMPATDKVDLTGKTILQIVPELDIGGAEITTLEISRAIVAGGGRSLVASEGGALEVDIKAAGGEIIHMKVASKNPFTIWRNAGRLAKLIQQENIDLIHARSRAPGWSGFIAARRLGRPYLATYHSKVHARPRAKVFYNSVMTRGRVTIANSYFTAARITSIHQTPPENLRVIPRGCNPQELDRHRFTEDEIKAKRQAWGVPDNVFVILCPARLTKWKGQHVLLSALSQLKSDIKPHLVLVGSAQGRNDYVADLTAQAAKLGLGEQLTFAGLEYNMPVAYAAANMAVLPSIEAEPFGRTTIEAQAASLPVIASDDGGFRETVVADKPEKGGTGWLVTPGDAYALALAIDTALAMPADELYQMGANGRKNVEANYTQTAMCNRTLNVYKELIG